MVLLPQRLVLPFAPLLDKARRRPAAAHRLGILDATRELSMARELFARRVRLEDTPLLFCLFLLRSKLGALRLLARTERLRLVEERHRARCFLWRLFDRPFLRVPVQPFLHEAFALFHGYIRFVRLVVIVRVHKLLLDRSPALGPFCHKTSFT